MKTYNKKKIFLLGYSFGSVLGLEMINKHPDLFYAFIGMAQVIPGKKEEGYTLTYKWLRDTLTTINDTASLRMLDTDEKMFRKLVTKYNAYQLSEIPKDTLQKSSPFSFEGYKEMHRKGASFSKHHINRNSNQGARQNLPPSEVKIPIYFFTGLHDHVCEPQIVVDYFNILKAPTKEMVWFRNSAHRIATDEPEKFQDELIRVAKENWR
jgi:proline iminopeptidase